MAASTVPGEPLSPQDPHGPEIERLLVRSGAIRLRTEFKTTEGSQPIQKHRKTKSAGSTVTQVVWTVGGAICGTLVGSLVGQPVLGGVVGASLGSRKIDVE